MKAKERAVVWLQWISWITLAFGIFFGFIAAYMEVALQLEAGLYFMVGSMGLLALAGFLMGLSAKLEK